VSRGGTGPRRAQVVSSDVATETRTLRYADTGEVVTVVASTNEPRWATLRDQGLAVASTLNLFPKTVVADDPVIVQVSRGSWVVGCGSCLTWCASAMVLMRPRAPLPPPLAHPLASCDALAVVRAQGGRIKTVLFLIILPIIVLSVLISYATQPPTVVQGSIPEPSLSQYNGILQYEPSCTCRNVPALSSALTWNLPPSVDFTRNFCSVMYALRDHCTNSTVCSTTQQGAMLTSGYAFPMFKVCSLMELSLSIVYANVNATQAGTILLAEADFAALVERTIVNELEKVMIVQLQFEMALDMPTRLGLTVTGLDPSWGATVRNPPNCTCKQPYAPDAVPTDILDGSAICHFHSIVDNRPGTENDTIWVCSAGAPQFNFPVDIFRQPQTYEAINLTNYQSLMNFTSVPGDPSFSNNVIFLAMQLLSNPYPNAAITPAPGLYNYSYTQYFARCAPSQCNYVYETRLSFVAILTATLGECLHGSRLRRHGTVHHATRLPAVAIAA